MEQVCRTRGWEPYLRIKDEGFSAGTLKRPGLSEISWLIQNEEIDGLVCTWYDRLTRSRDFYVLDIEFKAHNIQFVTLHDPADTRTASGRFMESMIVAAKTYDREQTSEKVRTKMRMRAAKGLHSGGSVPFGFVMNPETKLLSPDPAMSAVLEQMFQVYVDERSDFAVRDWLQAHQIPNARGKMAWQVSTIRDMLCNRRYIGELEANKRNKGLDEVPENEVYHIIKAPHDAAVPLPLFQLAQSVRAEKLGQSPNRVGRPRHHSYTQCGRVNILQGTLLCGACGHAMTPHYTSKTAKVSNDDVQERQYFHYYACAAQIKGTMEEQHKNRIKADVIESWMLDTVEELLQSERVITKAVERAGEARSLNQRPQRAALELNRAARHENQKRVEEMLETVSSGNATGALWQMLNERATHLQVEGERLKREERQLNGEIANLEIDFDAQTFMKTLCDFKKLASVAEPEELQKLIRLAVRRIEWMPEGVHRVQFYSR